MKVIGAAVMVGIGKISDRLLIRKPFVWPFMFLGAIAFVCSYLAGTQHFWLSFTGLIIACICMYAPYGPYWAMIPEMVSRNVVGESMALINTCGAAGGFVGTYGVGALYDLTHSYAASFGCLGIALAAEDWAIRCNLVTVQDQVMRDFTADRSRTGKDKVVERQCCKGLADGGIAGNHMDLIGRKELGDGRAQGR